MSSSGTGRDGELENLLGQFLVASFQTDKLAELIYEKLSFRGRPKEIRILIPSSPSSSSSSFNSPGRFGQTSTGRGGGSGSGRPPLVLTLRIEPYNPAQPYAEKEPVKLAEGALKIICVLESPTLDFSSSGTGEPEVAIEDMLAGSFSWWNSQGQHRELKLDEWKISTSILNAKDGEQASEVYQILDTLAAKRSGEQSASP